MTVFTNGKHIPITLYDIPYYFERGDLLLDDDNQIIEDPLAYMKEKTGLKYNGRSELKIPIADPKILNKCIADLQYISMMSGIDIDQEDQ